MRLIKNLSSLTQVCGSAYNKMVLAELRDVMQLNVAQLLKETIGSARDYEVSGVVDIAGNGAGSMVDGQVRLLRTNHGILVKGMLHTEVGVTCSRCLTSFRRPLALNIEEEYFPTVDIVSGVSAPVSDELGSFTTDEQHVLDLAEAARQYALLAIPMKPLCGEDCAGLCLDCGHDLNLGLCDCSSRSVDRPLGGIDLISQWAERNGLDYVCFTQEKMCQGAPG